uniref:COMM domain containing 9 n=1 Tax=Accipiter nisus TaxID=211598 RepID=A0A8B9MQU1_9AVES
MAALRQEDFAALQSLLKVSGQRSCWGTGAPRPGPAAAASPGARLSAPPQLPSALLPARRRRRTSCGSCAGSVSPARLPASARWRSAPASTSPPAPRKRSSSAWRNEAQASQISLPRLVDMDWRVDIKTSSDSISRMAVPTCLLQLKIQEDVALCGNSPVVSALTVELSKETLDTMLEGLGRIRDQLSAVANK